MDLSFSFLTIVCDSCLLPCVEIVGHSKPKSSAEKSVKR